MADEPVTKADLTNAVREIKEYVDERTHEIKEYVDERTREIKEYVDERTHDAETRLLRSFSDFNSSLNVRMSKIEADVGNVDAASTKRLGFLETKVTDMEIRLLKLESGSASGGLRH